MVAVARSVTLLNRIWHSNPRKFPATELTMIVVAAWSA